MTERQQVIDPSEILQGDKLVVTVEVTANTPWMARGNNGGYFNGFTKDSGEFGKTFYLSAIHKVVRLSELPDYPAEPKDNSIAIFRHRNGDVPHAAKRTGGSWFVTGNENAFSWASLWTLFPSDLYTYHRW